MKDIKKTAVLVGTIILVAMIVLLIVNNAKYGVELLTRTKLSANDPTVVIAFDKLDKMTYLRTAQFKNENISSIDIIQFVLDNMEEDDYTVKKVKPVKIMCEITETIHFQTEEKKDCNLRIIKNSTFADIEQKYFNTRTVTEFPEIRYHGYYCKNDGTKYYCLVSSYNESILDYSLFADAYQEKDKAVLYEYYLRIDLNDEKRCNKYLDEEYCSDYVNKEKPEIDDEIIKKDGVLYEHVFKETENNYYLEQSHIVSERNKVK